MRKAFQATAKALHLGLRITGNTAQVPGQARHTLLPQTTPGAQASFTTASFVAH